MKRAIVALLVVGAGAAGGMLVNGWALASRNSSGTYTPTTTGTYPFVSGTTISSSTMNGLFSDLSTEMTDSLSRSGKGGMLAPIRVPDGSATAPSHSFTSETGSGLWRAGSSDVRMSVNGAAARSGWNGAGFRLIDQTSGANAYGVNLAAPALAASYTITTPAAAPASTLPLSMSSGGVLSAAQMATDQIADQAVTAAKIANATITATQIANTTITASQIANTTITASQIANSTITNAKQNFGTPSATTDVAIKSYVDGLVTRKAYLVGLSADQSLAPCGNWETIAASPSYASGTHVSFDCQLYAFTGDSATTATLDIRADASTSPTGVRYISTVLRSGTGCGSGSVTGPASTMITADAGAIAWGVWTLCTNYGNTFGRLSGSMYLGSGGTISVQGYHGCGSGDAVSIGSGSYCVFTNT
jgi:hypothetical protein